MRRSLPLALALLGAPSGALAQSLVVDTDALAVDASDTDAIVADVSAASADAAPSDEGSCVADPQPSGHEVRIETTLSPTRPTVGDRVLITYRLYARSSDRVEFEPDPAAFAQPGNELEYARTQPDRDRSAHAGPGGLVYGEVAVAVQPFKTGEVVIPRQLARLNAAGDVVRICTPAVRFRTHDPFGNERAPRPKDVTDPETVQVDSLRWRYVMFAVDGAFVLILSTLAVNSYLRRRPKPVAPPPPPRPAWITAMEALDLLAHSDLLSRGQTKEYYDQVSDIVRRYVGALRGFDALEMTTDEVLSRVRKVPVAGVTVVELEHLLRECDLVKFARWIPSHEESAEVLTQAYTIVRRSSPAGQSAPVARAETKAKREEKPVEKEAAPKEEALKEEPAKAEEEKKADGEAESRTNEPGEKRA